MGGTATKVVPTHQIVLLGSERGRVWGEYVDHLQRRHGIAPTQCCLASVCSLTFEEMSFMIWEIGDGPHSAALGNLIHTSRAVIMAVHDSREQRRLERQWGKQPHVYCEEDTNHHSIPSIFASAFKRAAAPI